MGRATVATVQRRGRGALSRLFVGTAAGGDRLWGGCGIWESAAKVERTLRHRGADQRGPNDHQAACGADQAAGGGAGAAATGRRGAIDWRVGWQHAADCKYWHE